MKAGFLQYNPAYLKVGQNLDEAAKLIGTADADLIVLPELFASGYFFQSKDDLARVAEEIPSGPTCRALQEWSQNTNTTFVAGLPEKAGDQVFNSAVVVRPNGSCSTYRKVHLFYEETRWFSPGNLGFPVFEETDREGNRYRLGVMICFDWYFPEAARSLALGGADVIAHPSNLVRKDCPRAMPIRALENHVFTITANRIGEERKGEERLAFIGQSLICDPNGNVLVQAGRDDTALSIADISPVEARNRRITAHNDLFADRRPSSYRG